MLRRFNADGDWNDAGEQILDARSIEAGSTTVDFDAPAVVVLGESFARFRFTTPPAADDPPLLPYDPPAADLMVGEVEDYRVRIVPMGAGIFGDGFE